MLLRANPLTAEIQRCTVARQSGVGSSIDAVARFEDDDIDACLREYTGGAESRKACANDGNIGSAVAGLGELGEKLLMCLLLTMPMICSGCLGYRR